MDTIQIFKEAAKALQQDERYLQLAKTRTANDEDEALQGKIGEFNLVRLQLNEEMGKDERDAEAVNELNARVNELYSDIMGNSSMADYNAAKENIQGLISHIHAIVSAAVNGDDPMTVCEPRPEGCSPEGCSSCGGGCG